MAESFVEPGANYGFFFNQSLCTGCKACQISCQDKHDSPVNVAYRRVVEYEGGSWMVDPLENTAVPNVFTYYTSIACNHCEDAPCVKVCPTTAMTRRNDGTIYVDQSKCVGCRYCEWSCPYSAPQFNAETGHMQKCDLCYDYREEGLNPACVSACPSRALDWGPIEELREKYGVVDGVAPLPDPAITRPHLVIHPYKDAQAWNAGTGFISDPQGV